MSRTQVPRRGKWATATLGNKTVLGNNAGHRNLLRNIFTMIPSEVLAWALSLQLLDADGWHGPKTLPSGQSGCSNIKSQCKEFNCINIGHFWPQCWKMLSDFHNLFVEMLPYHKKYVVTGLDAYRTQFYLQPLAPGCAKSLQLELAQSRGTKHSPSDQEGL